MQKVEIGVVFAICAASIANGHSGVPAESQTGCAKRIVSLSRKQLVGSPENISMLTAVRFNLDLPPSSSLERVVYGDFGVSTI